MSNTNYNTNNTSIFSNIGTFVSKSVQAAATTATTSAGIAVAIADNLDVVITAVNVLGVTAEAGLGKLVHEITDKPVTRELLKDREKLSDLVWETVNSSDEEESKSE